MGTKGFFRQRASKVTASDLDAALAKTGPAAVEWKLDGVRIQVHRDGDDVFIIK